LHWFLDKEERPEPWGWRAVIYKPLEQIDRADIDSLVTNQVKEGRTIEYKQALPTNSDKEKKDFLADVSSFANAAGGDLLFGVVDKRDANGKTTGQPESAPGLAGINVDMEIRRLDSMIQAGIGPRIAGVRTRPVEGFADGPVLLVRIPKSYASPHMVTFQDHSRFYSRNNGGKYPLDVIEIRSAFSLSESLPERVRRFRDERLAQIVADETPVPLQPQYARIVMHILPVAAFDTSNRIDLSSTRYSLQNLQTLGGYKAGDRYNFDGFVTYRMFTYTQLFRSGALEVVDSQMWPMTITTLNQFTFSAYEKALIEGLDGWLKYQQGLGLQTPTFVLLSLIGVKGWGLASDRPIHGRTPHQIDRDTLLLPDVLVEDYAQTAATVLRPVFDAVWQSAGWAGSPSYDQSGRWAVQ
jgi:hypothetical protein